MSEYFAFKYQHNPESTYQNNMHNKTNSEFKIYTALSNHSEPKRDSHRSDDHTSRKSSSFSSSTFGTRDQFQAAVSDLMSIPNFDNSKCFDCGGDHPSWVSVNNGIFLCLNCAGIHRGFGV